MDLGKIDLCIFCSGLIKATNDTLSLPSQHPHHPTYGSLLSSSKTCVVCQIITSLWDHFSSALNRHGVSNKTIEHESPVKITTQAARRMHSGVSWAILEASLTSTNTPLIGVSYFTLVVCPSGGKRFRIQEAHKSLTILEQIQHRPWMCGRGRRRPSTKR